MKNYDLYKLREVSGICHLYMDYIWRFENGNKNRVLIHL